MFRNPSPASASTSHMSDDDDFEPAPAKRKRMKLPREAASSKKKYGDKQDEGKHLPFYLSLLYLKNWKL